MSTCDCGTGPFSLHAPDCNVVILRKRPRIDCVNCDLDDAPQALESWFKANDWCAHCEDNYEPPDDDGECFRGGESAAYERDCMADIQRTLK